MPNPPEEFHVWFQFWVNLLYVALSLFAVVAIVVTLKGWQEIKVMLVRLKQSGDSDE
jgi:hypothetical protein